MEKSPADLSKLISESIGSRTFLSQLIEINRGLLQDSQESELSELLIELNNSKK